MKPNGVCSNCGMWSTRKFSVKRHITNLHGGNAYLVAFIDYLVGRQSGRYPPSSQPEFQNQEEKKYGFETFYEEFWKERARIAARGTKNLQM